ncbi:MAG: 3-dehydroquinate synthase [Kiritimatiellae bacterium]|nr:3-dehydroquinate synthase [Kiritimatiellia bacterium]
MNNIIDTSFSVSYNYPTIFTSQAFDTDNDTLVTTLQRLNEGRRHRVVFYIDAALATPQLISQIEAYCAAHTDVINLAAPVKSVAGGFEIKNNPEFIIATLKELGELHIDRQSFVVVIGGGSVIDAVGLAVALLHRGARLIRMPTTVLGQDDAGVGVKNGIDFNGQKNFMGCFAPPFAVINDVSFLTTLGDENWFGGFAEAIKVSIIRDGSFFEQLEQAAPAICARDISVAEGIIRRSAELHLRQISKGGDPFEFGSARPLDFGHWAAHRLEVISNHELGHGYAVSIGIALDTIYAQKLGLITEQEYKRIIKLLRALNLPIYSKWLEARNEQGELLVIKGAEDFREHLGGILNITLPTSIGTAIEVHELDTSKVAESIQELRP